MTNILPVFIQRIIDLEKVIDRLKTDPAIPENHPALSAVAATRDALLKLLPDIATASAPPKSTRTCAACRRRQVAHAIVLRTEHPEWFHHQIADEIGVTPRTLYRWKAYMMLTRNFEEEMRHSSKIEARKGFRNSNGDPDATVFDPDVE